MLNLILHVRHLTPVLSESWWRDQLGAAREIFNPHGINLIEGVINHLDFGDGDGVVDVGFCGPPPGLTQEQQQLFASASALPVSDLVIFVAANLQPSAWRGCASHPVNRPGLVLTQGQAGSKRWLLAHEIGHVLGLKHSTDKRRLMFGSAVWPDNPPPELPLGDLDAFLVAGLPLPSRNG